MPSDALQWLIDLMLPETSRLVTGLIILFVVVQLIANFREWLKTQWT